MSPRNRPLSPFLQIYRLPLVAWISITHRLAGIGLAVGLVLLAWWLTAAAAGPQTFAMVQGVLGSFPGRLVLFAVTACLFFHLVNGFRHLLWDVDVGFSLTQARTSALMVMAATALLTVLTWIVA